MSDLPPVGAQRGGVLIARTLVVRRMCGFLLLLGLVGTDALAAGGVVLPKGQDPAAWTEALALAGLTISVTGEGGVEILDQGGTWVLRARDAGGRVQEVTVAPPRDARAREDLAWLAKSMLRTTRAGSSWDDVRAPPVAPVVGPDAPASPATSALVPARAAGETAPSKPKLPPAPKPVTSSPSPVPSTGEVAAPVDVAAAPPPQPPLQAEPPPGTPAAAWPPAEPAPLGGVPAPPGPAPQEVARQPKAHGRVAVGGGVAWRDGAAFAATTNVSATVRFAGPSLAFEARWTPPRALLSTSFEGTLAETDLLLEGGWVFDAPLQPGLAVVAGASVRGYAAGAPLVVGVVPVVGVEVGVDTPPVGPFVVSPWVGALTDLRGTWIRVDGVPVALLQPVELRAGVSVVADFPKKD